MSASARPLPVSPAIAQSAVEWLLTLQSPEATEGTRAAWQHWLAQDPEHARAWRHIEAVNARLRGVASPLATVVAHAALTAPRSPARREAVRALAGLFVAGGAAWMAYEHTPWQSWLADERTGVGERRIVTLADGTAVMLNTDSAIDLRFTATERRVALLRGEIMVTTAKDRSAVPRPFIVQTAQGMLQPIGTRFAVRQFDDTTWAGVMEGAVRVHPRNGFGGERTLAAGEQLRFTDSQILAAGPLTEADSAWSEGMLVATDMRLSDFLAEVSRYRPGRLRCDPDAADLRVSGTYPVEDTDRILDALRSTLPVRMHLITRYWVTVLRA